MNDSDIEKIRGDFPIFSANPSLIYLDTAATSHKPQCVIDSMVQFYKMEYATVHRAIYDLCAKATEKYCRVRRLVQKWIGAKCESEIIFTKSTTEALNLIANSFGALMQPGDEIIISQMEHHSNFVPWQILARERNLRLRYLSITDNGEVDLEELQRLLCSKTRLISIAHITNNTGTINPVKEIITLAHAVGAKVCLDGAQAVAHIAINVVELDVDFYAFSAHKMYGPNGIGILYAKLELLQKMPPYQSGGDMIESVTIDQTSFALPPLKFEAGTPMIAQAIGLGQAIEYLQTIGQSKIHSYETEITEYALEQIQKIPQVQLMGNSKNRGSLISFFIKDIHMLDIATLLNSKGVSIRSGHLCSQPTLAHFGLASVGRISFGIYTLRREIDQFLIHLEDSIRILTA